MFIVHLFVSYAHVGLCHFFSSSLCRGSAAASACGSSWTFLFTFLQFYVNRWDTLTPMFKILNMLKLFQKSYYNL